MLLSWSSFVAMAFLAHGQTLPPSCESPVYCYGELLKTVQMARINKDSKTFVDMKMKNPQDTTLKNFQTFIKINPTPTKAQVKQFVDENFEEGKELGDWTLPDFQPEPAFLPNIVNETVREFAKDLIQIWPDLARHVKEEVSLNEEQYSLIPVPNGFIVPGGRFREYYYWDSYWIIDGLLVNEMTETARGMIDNFLSLVERFGFIPNGGRVYYLRRSQPPLLTPMAHLYYSYSKNTTWVKDNIDTLVKELNYWVDQTIQVQRGFRTYTLAHYNAVSDGPRPESYWEDVQTANKVPEESKKQQLYIDLKSGAESGWDFSARWIFDAQGGNVAPLENIQTRRVVPVDLNAFLCGAMRDISELYAEIDQPQQSAFWHEAYLEIRNAINAVLWDEEDGVWYDYDLELSQHRRLFYPSGLTPLWSRCFDEARGHELGQRIVQYLKDNGILEYLGGVPASKDQTGEQWDFPNAWPPLQDIVVRGLQNSGHPEAQEEAGILAARWVSSNILGYQENEVMFEKYSAVEPGKYGDGGEYDVQSGFGWSNGVALRFIHDYYVKSSQNVIRAGSALFWITLVILNLIK